MEKLPVIIYAISRAVLSNMVAIVATEHVKDG